jgi:bacterioferritin
MKGDKAVVDLLNEVLAGELVAINQYFLHAKMCQNWGLAALAERSRRESIEEMKHADEIIDRILFLEGLPNLQRLDPLHIGQSVPEQLQSDLDLEYAAVKRLRDGIALCRDQGDRTSEDLLASILESEEEHVDFLETQLDLMSKIGQQNYLQLQARPASA